MAHRERLVPVGGVTAVIEARSLYRFYRAGEDETLALQGVTLSVHPGQLVAVVGPSGSGKSTLLSCLAGLDEPAGGAVYVAGQRLSHRPEHQRTRIRAQHIGVLQQSRNLVAHLDIADNIRLVQRRVGAGRPEPAEELLASVGLAHRTSALPDQLSGGELQRAGLAVALANRPGVLLADEPTGELDGDTEAQVLDLMRESTAAGTAVLVVSHSTAVMDRADLVLTLADGRVVA